MHIPKNKIISLGISGLLLGFLAVVAYHPPAAALYSGSKATVCSALGNCGSGAVTVRNTIGSIISILSYIVGIAAVVMVIIGGFKYITSNGDSSNISSAKNTIIYALIGLAIAVLAQAIVAFVFHRI